MARGANPRAKAAMSLFLRGAARWFLCGCAAGSLVSGVLLLTGCVLPDGQPNWLLVRAIAYIIIGSFALGVWCPRWLRKWAEKQEEPKHEPVD